MALALAKRRAVAIQVDRGRAVSHHPLSVVVEMAFRPADTNLKLTAETAVRFAVVKMFTVQQAHGPGSGVRKLLTLPVLHLTVTEATDGAGCWCTVHQSTKLHQQK